MIEQVTELTPLQRAPAAAEPLLHLETWLYVSLAVTIAALLVGLLWLWRQWRRGRARPSSEPRRPLRVTRPQTTLSDDVAQIRSATLESRRYRDGCYALSHLVKQRLATAIGRPVQNMTASEIAALFEDQRIDRLVRELRGDKYSKRPPRLDEFERHCKLIPRVLGHQQPFELAGELAEQ